MPPFRDNGWTASAPPPPRFEPPPNTAPGPRLWSGGPVRLPAVRQPRPRIALAIYQAPPGAQGHRDAIDKINPALDSLRRDLAALSDQHSAMLRNPHVTAENLDFEEAEIARLRADIERLTVLREQYSAALPALVARDSGAWERIEAIAAPLREAKATLRAEIDAAYDAHATALAELLSRARALDMRHKGAEQQIARELRRGNWGAADLGPRITVHGDACIPHPNGGEPYFDGRRRAMIFGLPPGIVAYREG
jgi:hypothetical protein